ncbi:MAG: DUF2334 domain-containing protein [Limisphaerales bacterium]
MRYVILRDDDTNALTPAACLERLYRPFLDRGLPVNLAVIPNVRTNVTLPDGRPEGFLVAGDARVTDTMTIGSNQELIRYLRLNPGYRIVQHGYQHSRNEFDSRQRWQLGPWLDQGAELLMKAGFPRPQTFVAPYDKLSRTSLAEVAKRFRVLSTGWFELRRLPLAWWPKYVLKKIFRQPHWRVGRTLLLSHPGCLLSYHRDYDSILPAIRQRVAPGQLTVLVTHWWEYFRDNRPDDAFIRVLHQTADYLARERDIQVIAFDDLARDHARQRGRCRLNDEMCQPTGLTPLA